MNYEEWEEKYFGGNYTEFCKEYTEDWGEQLQKDREDMMEE